MTHIMTAQLKICLLVILFMFTMTLAACGQTGDLYLPEEESEEKSKERS